MSNGNKKKEISRKGIILKIVILILSIIILLYLYDRISKFEFDPFIIILILVLLFLIILGPFFLRKRRRSLYSKMFPERKRRAVQKKHTHKRRPIIVKEPKAIQPKIFKTIDFEFEYRKPLITNCENCGNILPSFVKNKCPFCQEEV
ncbi:hypothetical protein LCGC14_1050930 [marine sediment metagenome]|uniref:Uncharacterized protein n=1 Tax=marine sediment metagenome TaxID=412755 RepID=A0A0F9Q6Z8_9ZZZZ